jgi:hypothetical protein
MAIWAATAVTAAINAARIIIASLNLLPSRRYPGSPLNYIDRDFQR